MRPHPNGLWVYVHVAMFARFQKECSVLFIRDLLLGGGNERKEEKKITLN